MKLFFKIFPVGHCLKISPTDTFQINLQRSLGKWIFKFQRFVRWWISNFQGSFARFRWWISNFQGPFAKGSLVELQFPSFASVHWWVSNFQGSFKFFHFQGSLARFVGFWISNFQGSFARVRSNFLISKVRWRGSFPYTHHPTPPPPPPPPHTPP